MKSMDLLSIGAQNVSDVSCVMPVVPLFCYLSVRIKEVVHSGSVTFLK